MSFKIIFLKLQPYLPRDDELIHWGRVTHICFCKLIIIGSDNGLSPGRRQAIILTSAEILLLIQTLGTNYSEILNEIHTYVFKKMQLKLLFGKWWQFRLGLSASLFLCAKLVINSTKREILVWIHDLLAWTTSKSLDLNYFILCGNVRRYSSDIFTNGIWKTWSMACGTLRKHVCDY